jgi:hypothetical protein
MTPKLVQKSYNQGFYENIRADLPKQGFKQIGWGSSRYGFQRGNIVVKVPHNQGGYYDNIMEAYAYHLYRKKPDSQGRVFAPCRLLPNGCLMMVFVDRKLRTEMPEWTHIIDGAQCGVFKDRIVVYDSAYNLYYDDDELIKKKSVEWAGVNG